MSALLEVEDLSVRYGGIQAVDAVSLTVHRGEVVALLGANGAGKSSLLRAVSGLERKVNGMVRLQGRDISRLRPDLVTKAGLAHVPEGRAVIGPLSVEENLLLALRAPGRTPTGSAREALDAVYTTFPRLKERRRQVSGLLSGGEQQMLAIGRGMVMNPVLLMLDEPSMGLAPVIIEEVYDILRNRVGPLVEVSILLAEQSANLALGVADRAYVLARGSQVFAGSVSELSADVTVGAYLGSV
jgi:branched-chain amino acid transport system ATP-binding protein